MTTKEVCNINAEQIDTTNIEKYFEQGLFAPIELKDYSEKVAAFIAHMPQNIAVQRLSALSSRWEELIAPQWTMHKMTVFQGIIDYMNEKQIYQGKQYIPETPTITDLKALPDQFKAKIFDQAPFEALLKSLIPR